MSLLFSHTYFHTELKTTTLFHRVSWHNCNTQLWEVLGLNLSQDTNSSNLNFIFVVILNPFMKCQDII
jgi:hypothetical protein